MAAITIANVTAFPKIHFPPPIHQDFIRDIPCHTADMFWNWNTVGACFISRTWRIQSASMFAGTCIAVVLFTIAHEGFRFLGRFYDRWALETFGDGEYCRPVVSMQLVRAGIFTLQVVTGYFLMLLAMYVNGYYLICIFLGSFIGFFAFHWDFDPAETKREDGRWDRERRG